MFRRWSNASQRLDLRPIPVFILGVRQMVEPNVSNGRNTSIKQSCERQETFLQNVLTKYFDRTDLCCTDFVVQFRRFFILENVRGRHAISPGGI
jgi:hypothetical protein